MFYLVKVSPTSRVTSLHILLTTLEFLDYIFFYNKKTDMKFIILVSNLKEISLSVFS